MLAQLLHIDALRAAGRGDEARRVLASIAEEWLLGQGPVWASQWKRLLELAKKLRVPPDDPRIPSAVILRRMVASRFRCMAIAVALSAGCGSPSSPADDASVDATDPGDTGSTLVDSGSSPVDSGSSPLDSALADGALADGALADGALADGALADGAAADATAPGDSSTDASTDPGTDGGATGCVRSFGTALTPEFGRIDGTVVAVIGPSDLGCLHDDDHVIIQVRMAGAVYRLWVNIGRTEGDVWQRSTTAPLGAPAWAEGWHPGVALDYVTTFGLASTEFASARPDEITSLLQTEIAPGDPIAIYATGYASGDGAHNIHRSATGMDGAIAIGPMAATSTFFLFRFATQTF